VHGDYNPSQLPIRLEDITEEEVSTAVRQLKNGKSAGVDQIQAELLKTADFVIPHLTRVCNLAARSCTRRLEEGCYHPAAKER